MTYSSKKDAWLVLLVAAAILLPVAFGLYNLLAPGGDVPAARSSILVGTLAGATVLWLTYPLYYQITSTALIIRCGLLRRQIPLSTIEDVRPTRNPLSAPAWSLDRLRINYRQRGEVNFALISPADKTRFLRELAAKDSGLELRGDRVVRTT